MLKGIDPLLGPELLAILRAMGHGDEIVVADANFPSRSLAKGLVRVDSHQHFWRLGRVDYGWLNAVDHPKIARDFLPPDLAPLLAQGKFERTILVQAAPTEAETGFLLELANTAAFVAGVVGWIDFDSPDAP